MKTNLLTFLLLTMLCVYANGQTIPDPVAYFLEKYTHEPNDKVLKTQVDFAQNGKKIILLAYSSSVDRSGYLWMAFAPVKGGYEQMPVIEVNGKNNQGAVRFRTDALHQGQVAELKSYGLLSYFPSGSSGELTGVVLKGDALTQVPIKQVHPEGVDGTLYKSLFQGRGLNVQVEEIAIPQGK